MEKIIEHIFKKIEQKKQYILPVVLVTVLIGANAGAYYGIKKQTDDKIKALQAQISELKNQLNPDIGAQNKNVSEQNTANQSNLSPQESQKREAIRIASQDDLLISAVARTTPAVVSIVISKDVPQLEVVYENPFGNDPFFRDFGIQIPRYRQKGTIKKEVGGGTGFIIRQDGYIVTNKHVVADAEASYTALLSDGRQKSARVIYRDPNYDIAIIKIDGSGYKSTSLGNSADLKLGQTVIAIGNALAEYNNSVSVGIISGLNRTIEASNSLGQSEKLTGVIQTDAAINPGNSGGPLIDLNGSVIGINVATVIGSNSISFSIPINPIKNIINSVIR